MIPEATLKVRALEAEEKKARESTRAYARLTKSAAEGLAHEPASTASRIELERYSARALEWGSRASDLHTRLQMARQEEHDALQG